MKKYTTYKKIEQPYFNFSELLGFPILPICAIAFLSFGILFFFGLSVMILSNVVISGIVTYVLHGFKNASPNGSRNVNMQIPGLIAILSLLPTFLVVLGIILLTNTGVYIFVTFQHTGVFYATYFYSWLFVMLGLPVMYVVAQELRYQFQLYYQAYYFTPLYVSIVHDYELMVSAITVTFLQTKKKFMSDVSVPSRKEVEHIGKLSKLSVSERNDCLYDPLFDEQVYIPKGTDRLKITWYSATENVYYDGELDFPFDKLEFVANKYPLDVPAFLRGKKTDRVTLSILLGGKIELFNKHQNLLQPIEISSVEASEKDQKEWLDALKYVYRVKRLPVLMHTIKQSNAIEKRAEITDYICSWQITGSGLDGHNVEMKDVKNNYTTTDPLAWNVFEQRRLPIFFEIDYHKYTWLHIHVDAEKLYDLILSLADKEPALTFDFQLDLETAAAELRVKNKDNVLLFDGWEKVITFRWEEAKEMVLESKDFTIKNNFLKDIYELIVAQDYSGAEQLCKMALRKYPYFPMIYFYEARLLWYVQGFEASYAQESYFLEQTKTDPYAYAQIYNHYGCLYDEQKRYAQALTSFEKAYASYSKDVTYLSNIAECYYKLKDAKNALKYANECVEKEFTPGFSAAMIEEIIANKGVLV